MTTATEVSSSPISRLMSMPAWGRWPLLAAMGILVLTIVQRVSGTELLTSGSTSGAMLRWAVPIMLAGLGGLFAERSGVVNIGLEGMMILGTWFGAWGAINWGPWGGLIAGIVGGALGGLLHAVATVHFGVDHTVSGVAILLLSPALTRFLSERYFTGSIGGSVSQSPRVTGLPEFTVPFLAGGRIGDWQSPDVLGSIDDSGIFWLADIAAVLRGMMSGLGVFTVLAFSCVPLTAWIFARTRVGLRMKICGENPKAGESLGIGIYRHKYLGVVVSGALSGMAGAYIVLELTGVYRGGQTTGRGFIGLAALIFGNWRAIGVLAGALLFGYPFGLSLIDFNAQSSGEATRSLLLAIAIVLAGVAVWAFKREKRIDMALAGLMAVGALVWYLLTDTAASWLPNTMPYFLVLIVLVFASQRLRPPATAGQPFRRGET